LKYSRRLFSAQKRIGDASSRGSRMGEGEDTAKSGMFMRNGQAALMNIPD